MTNEGWLGIACVCRLEATSRDRALPEGRGDTCRRGRVPAHDLVAGPATVDRSGDAEIFRCHLPEAVARERQLARLAAQATRTPQTDTEHLSADRTFDAIHVDAPTLDVDTGNGWHPSLDVIVAFSRPGALRNLQGP